MKKYRTLREVDIDEIIAREKLYNAKLWKAMHDDPVKFFSRRNKQRWPSRLGLEGSTIHTAHWAARLTRVKHLSPDEELAVRRYSMFWPLPIGRELLRQYENFIHTSGRSGVFGDWSFIQTVAPCSNEECAAWILDTELNATRIEAFGIIESDLGPIPEWPGGVFRPRRAVIRVTGANPHSSDVVQLCRDVSDWWNGYADLTMHRGRPRLDVTFEQAQAAYWDCHDAFEEEGETRRPSQADVLDRMAIDGLGIGKTKFGELIQEWRSAGRAWRPERP